MKFFFTDDVEIWTKIVKLRWEGMSYVARRTKAFAGCAPRPGNLLCDNLIEFHGVIKLKNGVLIGIERGEAEIALERNCGLLFPSSLPSPHVST
jgi:hypothetical protein